MRAFLLWTVLAIGVVVFIAAFASVWRHQAHAATAVQPKAGVEYVWAMVPWLILALAAAPAVHRILASG